MKKICLLLLFLSLSTVQAQDYLDKHYMHKRDRPTLFDGVLETVRLKDSVSDSPFVSKLSMYDAQGINTFNYNFNHRGETTYVEQTSLLKEGLEMTVMQDIGEQSDTLLISYNKDRYVTREIWRWGKSKRIDTVHFIYDNNQRLIAEKRIDFWRISDTMIYENNRLKTILIIDPYDKNDRDSIAFTYDKNNRLAKVVTHTTMEKFYENSYFEYPHEGNTVKETIEHFLDNERQYTHIETKTFWDNKQVKTFAREIYKKGKLVSKTDCIYAKEGYLKRYVYEDLVKNKTIISETTFIKNP
jgi:hypothetical protein